MEVSVFGQCLSSLKLPNNMAVVGTQRKISSDLMRLLILANLTNEVLPFLPSFGKHWKELHLLLFYNVEIVKGHVISEGASYSYAYFAVLLFTRKKGIMREALWSFWNVFLTHLMISPKKLSFCQTENDGNFTASASFT